MKMAKNAISVQFRSSPPRQRELCLCEELSLSEPEAPNLAVSAMPRCGLLYLSVGPCLGEGPLCLGKLDVLFSLFSFINSRNHHLLVRITIELNNKHEIGLIDNPNK